MVRKREGEREREEDWLRRERGRERTRNEKTERVIISGRIKATNPDQVMSAHYLFHVRVARFASYKRLTKQEQTS